MNCFVGVRNALIPAVALWAGFIWAVEHLLTVIVLPVLAAIFGGWILFSIFRRPEGRLRPGPDSRDGRIEDGSELLYDREARRREGQRDLEEALEIFEAVWAGESHRQVEDRHVVAALNLAAGYEAQIVAAEEALGVLTGVA